METVEILGVPVACLERQGLVDTVLEWCRDKQARTIYYANAHCLNLAWEDPGYRALLRQADLVYADGVSLAWASRYLGGCRLHKLTGADWIDPFCAAAQVQGVTIYLVGGQAGVAQQAADHLLAKYPALKILGVADGFFERKPVQQVLEEIQALAPELVWVGMGAPRQEQWIAQGRQGSAAGVWWGVGALFDFLAGVERRAPGWMLESGLEWLWRLGQDPGGKWQRYLLGNPKFIGRILAQKAGRRRN